MVDEGEKRLLCRTNGVIRGLKGRSMKVKRTLVAVYDMCKAGHRVVFDLDEPGSYAEHKMTGERQPFILRGRTWDMDLELVPFADTKAAYAEMREALPQKPLCLFQRQVEEEAQKTASILWP